MSFLWGVITLPWDIYLTLYVRLFNVASKNNPPAISAFIAYCVVAVIQGTLIYALIQEFMGSVSNLTGPVSMSGARAEGFLMGVPLVILNFLILNGRHDKIIARFSSMPKERQKFLNVLAVSAVLFIVGFFFWSLPPVSDS